MSFRPRAKPTAHLSAGSDGGTRGAAERLSSVLAVGAASFPLVSMISTNAGEHGAGGEKVNPWLHIGEDENMLILKALKAIRSGKDVFHKAVEVFTSYGDISHCITVAYEVPDGVAFDMYPYPPSANTLSWMTSGTDASTNHGRFLSKMRDVIAHLFPGNSIREFIIVQRKGLTIDGRRAKDRLFASLFLTNNFGVTAAQNGSLDVHTATVIAEAFLVSTVNDLIGRDCYVAKRSVAKTSTNYSGGQARSATYDVHMVLANEGDCAGHRV